MREIMKNKGSKWNTDKANTYQVVYYFIKIF